MKLITLSSLFFITLNTYALELEIGKWYPVFTCDNGAMVIDQAITGVSGSYKSFSHQLVIRDKNIVNWFLSNGAAYSTGNNNEIIFGQLSPRFENELFHSDLYLTEEVKFNYSQTNLSIYLNVYGSGHSANWYFRDCQKTMFTDLF